MQIYFNNNQVLFLVKENNNQTLFQLYIYSYGVCLIS